MATSQWASLNFGTLTVNYGGGKYTSPSFSGLTDIDNSSVYVTGGATVTLAGGDQLQQSHQNWTTTFQATGSGSVLSFPR